ncbi:MAG: hypothetical protein JWN04_1903 [Myxococcaceae bacterium]|nr:hypothetical protein [Myxococcaceae bacterium]
MPKPPDEQAEHHGFDGEADYLALADSPIFLPRSYLYWGTPVGAKGHRENLVFGLEYALHLPIYSNLRNQALQGKNWAGATTLSFEGDLRMIDSESKPVRMPSYRPSLTGQLFYIWHRSAPVLLGGRTGVYHYSNGQEKCTFDPNQPDNSEPCRAATDKVTNVVASLNRVNGNFSTNGWMLELNARVHQVNTKGVAIGHLSGGFSLRGMIAQGPGAMEPALRRLYGWGRLQWNLEGKKRFGWAAVTVRGSATFYPDTDGRTPNKSGQVEVVLGPYWLTGLGFFARYYGGRDFYNAFFVDRIEQFVTGLAWDGERPLKFKRD